MGERFGPTLRRMWLFCVPLTGRVGITSDPGLGITGQQKSWSAPRQDYRNRGSLPHMYSESDRTLAASHFYRFHTSAVHQHCLLHVTPHPSIRAFYTTVVRVIVKVPLSGRSQACYRQSHLVSGSHAAGHTPVRGRNIAPVTRVSQVTDAECEGVGVKLHQRGAGDRRWTGPCPGSLSR